MAYSVVSENQHYVTTILQGLFY